MRLIKIIGDMQMEILKTSLITSALILSTSANSALVERLGGLAYYDTVLNITWLANANLAATATFGFENDISSAGSMRWETANSWVAGMNAAGGTGYLGYNDWRLPTVRPVDGIQLNFSARTSDATTDWGYAETGTGWVDVNGVQASELGHMYYVNLNGVAGEGLLSSGPFYNIQYHSYFTNMGSFEDGNVWIFNMQPGEQTKTYLNQDLFAWAVRDGDVAVSTVPVPAAVWLFGSGLIGLAGIVRRKKV